MGGVRNRWVGVGERRCVGGDCREWVGWGSGRGLCERLMRENVGVGGLSWKGLR